MSPSLPSVGWRSVDLEILSMGLINHLNLFEDPSRPFHWLHLAAVSRLPLRKVTHLLFDYFGELLELPMFGIRMTFR